MDEPRPTTDEFHHRLRTVLHNLAVANGVTGFEAVGVLSYLAAEENAKLTAKVAELEATVAELQSDYRTLDRGCERMTKKATELGERVAALAEENDRLTAKAEELEDIVTHLRVMRDSLINAGIARVELCEKQAQRIAELEATLADARSMLFTVPPKRFPWPPNPFRI
jgi:predicted RNase H-like nuclease (RuvC/YqgF family)